MKRTKFVTLPVIMLLALLFLLANMFYIAGCSNSNRITIWTSGEDYRNNYYLEELRKEFPEYNIRLEYMNSSTIASKVMAEGKNCSADIILSEEYGYLYKCEQYLVELTEFDYSVYLEELIPESHKFTPELKNGGCVIINRSVLEKNNVAVPETYADLIKPEYKNLISMPSPASSGTGYMFLRLLTNEWGEDNAFDWFNGFSKNVLQYTSSGSGPVNALIQGEVGIGLGMISQAVTEINKGVNLEIKFLDVGAPYSMYGNAVLSHNASRTGVMEVFNYLSTDLCKENNIRFFPEQIFKDFKPSVEGFPDVIYGNMSNDTLDAKEALLKKWNFS